MCFCHTHARMHAHAAAAPAAGLPSSGVPLMEPAPPGLSMVAHSAAGMRYESYLWGQAGSKHLMQHTHVAPTASQPPQSAQHLILTTPATSAQVQACRARVL